MRTAARSNQGSLWEAVRPQLDEALASLPTRQQEVLILHFLQGMSREEVARTLHCGQETVNTHVTRGLQKLRQRLRRSGLYLPLPTLEAQLRKWLKPHPPQGWAASGTGGGLKDPVSPFSARVAMEVERECLGFQLAGLGLALPLGLSLALVVAISAVYFASAKPIAPVGANPVTILPPGSLAAATPPVPDHDGLHLDDPRLWILDEPGGAMGKPIQRYKTWVEVPFDPPLGFRFWKMGLFHHRYWPLTAAPVSLRAGITYTPRASRSGSFQLMALLDPRRPLQDGLQPSLHLLCMQNGQWFVSQSANLKRSVFEQQRFDPGPHVLELRISDREWATFVDGRCLYRDAHGFSDLQVRLGMGFVTEPDPTVTLRVDQVTVGPSGWNGEAPSEDGF